MRNRPRILALTATPASTKGGGSSSSHPTVEMLSQLQLLISY